MGNTSIYAIVWNRRLDVALGIKRRHKVSGVLRSTIRYDDQLFVMLARSFQARGLAYYRP